MNSPPTDGSLANNWMGAYQPPTGYFDEFLDDQGCPRPHWKKIANHFGKIDSESWSARERQLDRLIHDNGITYNVYGEDESKLRPWDLDMLPLAMSQAEHEKLESALSQRAHLLNLILQDVYGRQTMLRSSKVNPHLVFANPAFLRPCHGLLPPRHRHLHIYAADIARSPDGSWWVLSDRVEAASGLGYALENRMLMSRVFPKALWEAEVQSLQPFVQRFCRHIESIAQQNTDSPNIALLTSGPGNETYFEQSFLARNLGYTLAEGADLTVRNNRLYMKTIGGVQPVDVLLRRVDSDWCDPLELRNESLIGIPGLVNAVRQGNLSVANSLGSGFIETTAMHAFLPWFARSFLGENLEIPSVATWWCGQSEEREYVIENIDKLAIKPTFWRDSSITLFGPYLSAQEKENLILRIRENPEGYCGQEIVSNGTIPIYENGKLESRHFQLRVFLIPDGNGWKMMPGGLARYASSENNLIVSMQRGGESKDAWVSRDHKKTKGKRATPELAPQAPVRRKSNDLPSRTANNLFWLGRYLERTESQARLLRTLNDLLINQVGTDSQTDMIPFLEQIIEPDTDLSEIIDPKSGVADFARAEQIAIRATYDLSNFESLISNLKHIEQAASTVKDRLSIDTWKRASKLRDLAEVSVTNNPSVFDDQTSILLDATLENLASFVGNLMENMTRSQGWRFMQIGRRAERGIAISCLLRSAFHQPGPINETLLSNLLIWADSSITYRRRYLNTLQSGRVLDMLCFDSSNPRSLAFQAESLRDTIAALPHRLKIDRHPIDVLSLRLYSRLGLSDPDTLLEGGKSKNRKEVESFFNALCDDFMELATTIEKTYFAHTFLLDESQAQTLIG